MAPLPPTAQPPKLISRVQSFIRGVAGAWMGPLNPLPAMAPQATGRQRDYQVGSNMVIRTREPGQITAKELRNFVMNCDVVSILIETRKDQVSALEWDIVPKDKTKIKKSQTPDAMAKEIKAFFKKPDKRSHWSTWIRPLLDDMFIIDALTLYKRRTIGGDLYSLDIMDGSLIKVLEDETGRVPMFPDPSYQQLLKGMPAVNYTTQDILYAPRNLRSWSIYGYSVVEQIIITAQTLINRAMFNANYYIEGNTPDAWLFMDSEMSMEQLAAFQDFLDAALSGDLAKRRRTKVVPGGTGAKFQETKANPMADEFDEYLIRIACYAFSISPAAFVKQMNRSTSETQKDAAAEEGLAPITRWIKELHDSIIEEEFGTDEYEFIFTETREMDQQAAAAIRQGDVKVGILTIDEARESIGRDPVGGSAAEPGIITGSGFMPLEMSVQQQNETHAAAIDAIKNPPPVAGSAGDGKKPSAGKGDGKVEKISGVKKNSTSLSRPAAAKARNAAARKAAVVLKKVGHSVSHQLQNSLLKTDPTVEGIVATLDLSGLQGLDLLSDDMNEIFTDAADSMIRDLGVKYDADLFNQVNTRGVEFARQRAADLVSEIEETTREKLRALITAGLEEKKTRDQIASDISAVDSSAFGEDRALLIADTEIAFANGQGTLQGLEQAQDAGVEVQKQWLLAEDACDICQENSDAGPIPLDEDFPSGDESTPAHPRCRCTVIGVVIDESSKL